MRFDVDWDEDEELIISDWFAEKELTQYNFRKSTKIMDIEIETKKATQFLFETKETGVLIWIPKSIYKLQQKDLTQTKLGD